MKPVWTLDKPPSGSRASPGYHWEGDAYYECNEETPIEYRGIDDGFDHMNYQEDYTDYWVCLPQWPVLDDADW